MILADKIIALRKKNGWSQEDLAEKMKVSRQSVSKWEGAQAVPDLEKILRLSELFGVSTDYLLKDELGEEEYVSTTNAADADRPLLRRVSMEEANEFLAVKESTAGRIAFGTFLCIIGVACLLLTGALADTGVLMIPANAVNAIGMIILLLFVAAAVAIFISCGIKTEQYDYLEKEVFETEYGVTGMVKERQKQYKDTYTRSIIIGTCLCILSVVPLFSGRGVAEENELLMTGTLCIMLVLVGIAVLFFINAGIRQESMQKLLQEGDYTKKKKKNVSVKATVAWVYWLLVTAGFLCYGFYVDDWKKSGMIFPVAGVVFAAVMVVVNAATKEE